MVQANYKLNVKDDHETNSKTEGSLRVTNVSVFLFNGNEGKLKGVARVVLNDEIQLTGLRIYEGSNGLFVSYPNDPYYKGEEYRQLFYPISKAFRDHIQVEILNSYHQMLAEVV
jgi:stage V sporulation protein G